MNKLRIWLAYYILPKDTRKHLIKALSDNIKELEREVAELSRRNDSIKIVTNAEEAEEYQISEDISKSFEEFTKMMFKQEPEESEEETDGN